MDGLEQQLARIRIVLVQPAGELNIGSIARVMKNMGLAHLVLVDPQCNPHSDDAVRMAVHAADVLAAAQQVDSLPDALAGCQRAIATTARERPETPWEHPRAGLSWLLPDPNLPDQQSALIFGPEDRGLSNTELNYAQRFVKIPSSPQYPSLNLAQAVAVCAYELAQLARDPIQPALTVDPSALPADLEDVAPLDDVERYYHHLEQVLLKIGYLYPHTAASRMEKFRRLFKRANVSSAELSMLRGMLRQTEWALQRSPVSDPEATD